MPQARAEALGCVLKRQHQIKPRRRRRRRNRMVERGLGFFGIKASMAGFTWVGSKSAKRGQVTLVEQRIGGQGVAGRKLSGEGLDMEVIADSLGVGPVFGGSGRSSALLVGLSGPASARCALGRLDRVDQQHRDRHRPHAARARG